MSMSSVQTLPATGQRIPDFPQAEFSRYRGRRNLVLLVSPADELVNELASKMEELSYQETQVLVLSPAARESAFPVLIDAGLGVHSVLGGVNEGKPAPAVYVTDRYGEIYAAFRASEGARLPDASAILGWIEFINSQCPE
jgi:hypothetical protein